MKRMTGLLPLLLTSSPAWAMHISEGILPPGWALLWFVVAAAGRWIGFS